MKLPLTRGYNAIIDEADEGLASQFTWHVSLHDGKPYARTNIPRADGGFRTESLHRLIYGAVPSGLVVDHINGNSLDNRRENLRAVSQKVNSRNRKGPNRNNKSGIRGVYHRPGRWIAQIRVNNYLFSLGSFRTAEEAAAARRRAEKTYFGAAA